MLVILLNQHGHILADEHRMNNRNIQFPMVCQILGFGECKVMPFRTGQRLASSHNTDRNVYGA